MVVSLMALWLRLYGWPPSPCDEHDDSKDQPDDKENPGDIRSRSGDSTEAKNTGYQCDDQKS
jgi:hypothetical protein